MCVRYLASTSLPQPDEPKSQQAAEFLAPFGGRHVVRVQRIGAFHIGVAVFDGHYRSKATWKFTMGQRTRAIYCSEQVTNVRACSFRFCLR